MVAGMSRRELESALRRAGCVPPTGRGRGGHDKWDCPCGQHSANIPRHSNISPGVIRDTIKRLACLSEGWLT